MSFRKIIFWAHLVAGLVAGLVIATMALTGMTLAFRNQIVARVERGVAHVAPPPPGTTAQPLGDLVSAVREDQPDARISGVTVQHDPTAAVLVSTGRNEGVYVDPYSAEILGPTATAWRSFFQTMEDWHRALGREGPNRRIGQAVTGAACALYFWLLLSGFYLWWPAKVGRLRFKLGGKARDWNWHNVVGAWVSPLLLVTTFTGLVMSYRWANNLVFVLSGSPVPAAEGGGAPRGEGNRPGAGGPGERGNGERMASGARPDGAPRNREGAGGGSRMRIDYDRMVHAAAQAVPDWESINVRAGGPRGGGPGGAAGIAVSVRPQGVWPLFAQTQLTLDPATGAVLRTETYDQSNAGRKVRTWIRFLHTGEAFGWVGATLMALAAAGGVLLVFTGLSLAYRRFFAR